MIGPRPTPTGIDEETACLDDTLDFCVEMETGTGKTLVYRKTIYELYRQYAFTKFIILVPSVAIKEGVLSTFSVFERQLADVYGFTPACFEYDSRRLNRVRSFGFGMPGTTAASRCENRRS